MEDLKTKILDLKSKGVIQSKIAKTLNCSSGTVSYHCNPEVKEKAIKRKSDNRKTTAKLPHVYIEKELNIQIKNVLWQHAEAICLTKLIELGYEVFTPFNGGGEIDLIAIKDSIVSRIQIKSITPTNKEFISLNLERNSVNYKVNIPKPYENIDFFLIYDGNNIYKIFAEDVSSNLTLRYITPKNNQVNKIHMAFDYML